MPSYESELLKCEHSSFKCEIETPNIKTTKTGGVNRTMELTRLEYTQTINESQTSCPEQVAFLGICGQQYPVIRGVNKIGRDPDGCNIVLKLKSISRQHAVINILNSSKYMLMDLNSANRTKIGNKTLDPYKPYPLRNGDIVQFGKAFGIFTLLQENNDLSMTQILDIPDSPNFNVIVLETPDASDNDDPQDTSDDSIIFYEMDNHLPDH